MHIPFLDIDLVALIKWAGYVGIFIIIFAECGVFLGLFLPGDSLLFTAGFLASQGHLDLALLILICFVGAVLGDNFGYAFGRRVGPAIFRKEDSFFFHKKHLDRAAVFYEKHGGKTIILARFMPIIRTFAPILAGVGRMNYRVFVLYNLIGGALWAAGITALGYFLGSVIPGVDKYLLPIVLLIIIVSIMPGIIASLRSVTSKRRQNSGS